MGPRSKCGALNCPDPRPQPRLDRECKKAQDVGTETEAGVGAGAMAGAGARECFNLNDASEKLQRYAKMTTMSFTHPAQVTNHALYLLVRSNRPMAGGLWPEHATALPGGR